MNLPEALNLLESVFGRQEPSKLATYAVVLRHLGSDEIGRATEAALRTCEFFPAPGKLFELARGHNPAQAALPPHQEAHKHSASREIAGRFRDRGSPLDGFSYCAADLQGYPSRAMIAAKYGDPTYLTLHGEKDTAHAVRTWSDATVIVKQQTWGEL